MRRALLALLTVATFAAGTVRAGAAVPVVSVWGDSIGYETTPQLRTHLVGWTVDGHAWAGSAPCDWTTYVSTIAVEHPTVIVIETEGNAAPSPCMTALGLTMGTAAYYAEYQQDLTNLAAEGHAAGAHVLFVAGAPMKNAGWNAAVTQLIKIERAIAATYPDGTVTVTGGPRNAVSATGSYVDTKPCLTTEVTNPQCVAGQIPVRTQPPAIDAGIHLCPTGLPSTAPFLCLTYSSGELRFARAEASAVKAA